MSSSRVSTAQSKGMRSILRRTAGGRGYRGAQNRIRGSLFRKARFTSSSITDSFVTLVPDWSRYRARSSSSLRLVSLETLTLGDTDCNSSHAGYVLPLAFA